MNGVDPEAWLRYVFEPIANRPPNLVSHVPPWSYAAQIASTLNHAASQRCDVIID
ncbi:transposase domain-containing protein [Massilia sp. LMS1-1-1.1]